MSIPFVLTNKDPLQTQLSNKNVYISLTNLLTYKSALFTTYSFRHGHRCKRFTHNIKKCSNLVLDIDGVKRDMTSFISYDLMVKFILTFAYPLILRSYHYMLLKPYFSLSADFLTELSLPSTIRSYYKYGLDKKFDISYR